MPQAKPHPMPQLTLPPLSLYVHIPWCVKKCPYCDFNSHTANNQLPEEEYLQALIQDLELELPYVQGRKLSSIFFGGGTPSLFKLPNGALVLKNRLKSPWKPTPEPLSRKSFQATEVSVSIGSPSVYKVLTIITSKHSGAYILLSKQPMRFKWRETPASIILI